VARVHATPGLRPGIVAVVGFEARTADGFVAAARTVALHIENGATPKPRSWPEARAAVRSIRTDAAEGRCVPDAIRGWFTGVCAEHERSRAMRLGRETALAARRDGHREVQPGLFDSRAIHELGARLAQERERAADHHHRLVALERERLTLHATLRAALIVWR